MKIIINAAASIDGKIATRTGESKISSQSDLIMVHKLRCIVDGILVGISTVLRDDPILNVRLTKCTKLEKNPIRIIVDSKARIPLRSNIVKTAGQIETILAVTKSASRKKLEKLREKNIKIIVSGEKGERVNLKKIMTILEKKYGINKILVEGGGEINWSMIKNNLVDEIIITISPMIIGGKKSTSIISGKGFDEIKKCKRMKLEKVARKKNGEIRLYYKNIEK